MEEFDGYALKEKLFCNYIQWNDSTQQWTVHDYYFRKIDHLNEEIIEGDNLNLKINLHPNDFNVRLSMVETMNMFQLQDYIDEERMKGSKNLVFHIIEQQKRLAFPFATVILTLVAVAMASRKVRGGVGFDWDNNEQVWDKVQEELAELKIEVDKGDEQKISEEFGDLIFSLINYSRFVSINPEDALEKTNKKFIKRFQYMEKQLKAKGQEISELSLEEMDVYWNEAKTI